MQEHGDDDDDDGSSQGWIMASELDKEENEGGKVLLDR